jgi:hypothetical protein
MPGKPIVLVKGVERINLSDILGKLSSESLSAEDWKSTCRSLAIEGLALA